MAQIHPTPKQAVEKTSHMIEQMKIMLSTKSKGISVRNLRKQYLTIMITIFYIIETISIYFIP